MPYYGDSAQDIEEAMERFDSLDELDQVFTSDPTGRDRGCLHDALEDSRPPSMKGSAHMLVCNCPKCRTIC